MIVTVPLDRSLNAPRIERELVTAFSSGAEPVIALTKADLADDVTAAVNRVRAIAPGVEVVPVRLITGAAGAAVDTGVQRLAEMIRGRGTGVLLGPSGAGKSTLTNAMMGSAVRATGAVRAGDRRGRHVTATRALVALPGGGALIDTPGLRAIGLWDAEHGLDLTFREITQAAARCKFSDCSHSGEPSCAVMAAVESGDIAMDRLERYRVLYDELVDTEEERTVTERKRRQRADRRTPD